jgi:hypothetical protein
MYAHESILETNTDMVFRPDSTEELLREAAASEAATHHLALLLGMPDDRVREDPGAAMLAALSRFPARQPLRRERDRIVIEAIRTLCRGLPDGSRYKNHILTRLTEVSRQARERNWPEETWRGRDTWSE